MRPAGGWRTGPGTVCGCSEERLGLAGARLPPSRVIGAAGVNLVHRARSRTDSGLPPPGHMGVHACRPAPLVPGRHHTLELTLAPQPWSSAVRLGTALSHSSDTETSAASRPGSWKSPLGSSLHPSETCPRGTAGRGAQVSSTGGVRLTSAPRPWAPRSLLGNAGPSSVQPFSAPSSAGPQPRPWSVGPALCSREWGSSGPLEFWPLPAPAKTGLDLQLTGSQEAEFQPHA